MSCAFISAWRRWSPAVAWARAEDMLRVARLCQLRRPPMGGPSARVRGFLLAAPAQATQRRYVAALTVFNDWCVSLDIQWRLLSLEEQDWALVRRVGPHHLCARRNHRHSEDVPGTALCNVLARCVQLGFANPAGSRAAVVGAPALRCGDTRGSLRPAQRGLGLAPVLHRPPAYRPDAAAARPQHPVGE